MTIDQSRQLLIKGMNEHKQAKLNQSRILVIGAGGIATPVLTYLVMAGIEYVTIVDFDRIEASNLHRQTLYTPADIGKNKAEVAVRYLQERAPKARIQAITKKLDSNEMTHEITQHDLVLDCTDKRQVSYQINDGALVANKPAIFANASEMSGQLFVMVPQGERTIDFRALWGESLESSNEKPLGVIGPIPGVMGSLQALEAIKLLSGFAPTNQSALFHIDFLTLSIHRVNLSST